jgi:Tfp pilus assembly protein PilX
MLKPWMQRRPSDEEGFALLIVVACMVIGSIFAFAALGFALNTQRFSRTNQDWNGALAAAQAGVDDYIAYLNRNDNYARTPVDCTNIALKGPKTGTNTCGYTTATPVAWKSIDPANVGAGKFHYDIDASNLESDGIVQVTSTGKVGSKTRSLQVGISRGGSTDFLYYTDHEDADPANAQVYGQNADGSSQMDPRCAEYWWDVPNDRKTDSAAAHCVEITFIGGDSLDGPAHFNDTPLLTDSGSVKPKFSLGFETSDPKCMAPPDGPVIAGTPSTYKYCDRTQNSADFASSWPKYHETLQLPDNSDQFKNFPGCQYSGATRIRFIGDGTMKVWSDESTATLTAPACGTPAALGSAAGATVNVPTDQVIYVRGGTAGTHQCIPGEIGDGLPLGTSTTPTAGLIRKAYTEDINMTLPTQFCGQGNAYVEGTLKGRVTLATSNSITVTGDLVLANGLAGTDMLGLVAANSVEVFHPMVDNWECSASNCSTSNTGWHWDGTPSEVAGWPHRYNDIDNGNAPYPTVATDGIQISGSIQTLQHSFFVQSYNKGSTQGKLYVRGSIAQEWRGIVGTQNCTPMCGYVKDYRYDKRLRFASPPYFPQWAKAKWAGSYTGEVTPQYQ